MSNLETIILKTKKIESQLESMLGAEGRGLHEKVSSVESNLDEYYIRLIRKVATIRNKSMHEDGYVVDDINVFVNDCDEISNYLLSINTDMYLEVDDENDSSFVSHSIAIIVKSLLYLLGILTIGLTGYMGYSSQGIGGGIIGLVVGVALSWISYSIILSVSETLIFTIKDNIKVLSVSILVATSVYMFWGVKIPSADNNSFHSNSSESSQSNSIDQSDYPFKQKESEEIEESSSYVAFNDVLIKKNKKHLNEMPRNKNIKKRGIRYLNSLNAKSLEEVYYIGSWAKKIERIGTTNFPNEAQRLQKNSKLIINTVLNEKGQVLSTKIHTSSGSRILDNAALRIIKRASPFEVLPPKVTESFTQLQITRTFIFDAGQKNLRTE